MLKRTKKKDANIKKRKRKVVKEDEGKERAWDTCIFWKVVEKCHLLQGEWVGLLG